uniref:Uncharacterized protein n=1 Tax=Anguilla anguilla TaxID=7936 RepID=A0A0E9PPN8_ANGAN
MHMLNTISFFLFFFVSQIPFLRSIVKTFCL